MEAKDQDTCPIEPIPGIGPPQNLTDFSWRELQEASDAARDLGLPGPFICTNCIEKGAENPNFFIEDAYAIAPASLFHPGQDGYIGACRACAPEMGADQITNDRRKTDNPIVFIVFGILVLIILYTVLT